MPDARQARENRAYVRRLLREKRPDFAAALELAAQESLCQFLAASINDNGVMVGGPQIDSGGTVQDLNNLIPAGSGYQIQNATAINDNGQIVANTTSTHALLLTPS